MKVDEKKAKAYLENLGYVDIEYEPYGNIPPDFIIDHDIGVEVRRLNQHFMINEKNVPIEQLEYELVPKIRRLLKQIKNDKYENSIFVSVRYKRPLKIDSKLIKEIKSKLLLSIPHLEKELIIKINDNLLLRLNKSSKKFDDFVLISSISDFDSGGFIVREIYKNLNYIIKEKEKKVEPHLNKCRTWWLLLVDYLGNELDDLDIIQLNDLPRLKTLFDKVIIISPFDQYKSQEFIIEKAKV